MNIVDQEEIDNIIIKHYGKVPLMIENLVTELGLRIETRNDPTIGGDGFLVYNSSTKNYKIVINKYNNTYERMRFTIAHEVAHFILHRKSLEEKANDYFSESANGNKEAVNCEFLIARDGFNDLEREANNYAAELLMPKERIFEFYRSIKTVSIDLYANVFKVSNKAMEHRLRYLGLL